MEDLTPELFLDSAMNSWAWWPRPAPGDRVVVPFVIACGDCFFRHQQLYAACETTNPSRGAILNKKQLRSGAAMFGYTHLYGGVPGAGTTCSASPSRWGKSTRSASCPSCWS